MLNILAIALFQIASFSTPAQVSVSPQAPATINAIAALGGTGGWAGDIAALGGTGGWAGDIAALGGTGGWGNDVAALGGTGGWAGDIA